MPTAVEVRGVRRLATGAGIGLAAAVIGFVLPVAFLWLSSTNPGGFFTYGPDLIRAVAIFVIASSVLFLLSLFVYRRGFAALRHVDGRFVIASILCLVGSLGLILILVAAVVAAGSANDVVNCATGRPTHVLGCLRTSSPLGGATGLLGAVLGWLGGIGIVVGLAEAGRRYDRPSIASGAALYGLLLLVLLVPFAAVLLSAVPGSGYLVLAIPIFGLLAPAFVMAGSLAELPIVER